MANKYKMDMTRGPLVLQVGKYMLPVALTFILQIIFHAADLWVVGQYSSYKAVAAIGTTVTPIGILLNFFIGLSVGANALVAQLYGAKESKAMSRAVHTAIALALAASVLVVIIGLIASRSILQAINVPEDIMPGALCYFRLCILGMPAVLLYNFGCAILRAVGDTRRPLYFLGLSGVVNVLLNLFLVVVCHLDVEGVALATITSQILSAVLVLRVLHQSHGASRLYWRNIRFEFSLLRKVLHIGIPAGVQSACFSLSNLIIQGAINSFGGQAMAAMTIALNLEWGVYAWCYALHQSAISFAGQNLGARKYRRIIQCCWVCLGYAAILPMLLGLVMYWNGEALFKLFIAGDQPEIIHWGMIRMKILFTCYFLTGVMDTSTGLLRGLGKSIFPALITILWACAFRIWWVKVIFVKYPTMQCLMTSYPVSWAMTSLCSGIVLYMVCRKLLKSRSITLKRI